MFSLMCIDLCDVFFHVKNFFISPNCVQTSNPPPAVYPCLLKHIAQNVNSVDFHGPLVGLCEGTGMLLLLLLLYFHGPLLKTAATRKSSSLSTSTPLNIVR